MTDKKYIRSKIQERHNTILYLIRNCHLNYDKWKSYWRKQLCYLINETSKKNSVNIVDSVVGVYWGIRVNPTLTSKFPFEIAYNIDSSLARIRTILQWNEISSNPRFLRQITFAEYFGFKVYNLKEFYSK